MAQMLVITEGRSARRVMHALRSRGISVSKVSDPGRDSPPAKVQFSVSVPGYRVQEVYEVLAAGV